MRSIHVTAPGTAQVVEVDAPHPKPGEALLRVRFAGICGSDIQTFRGTQPFSSYPRVPGHEFSADIVSINGDGGNFEVGDIVTGVPYFHDGTCYSCRRGLINACEHNETMGVHRDGAFQELITMPLGRLHRANGVDPRDLAMVEPFSIGYHAIQRADVGYGDRVLVIGAGSIGLLTMLAAISRGAQVWIADVVASRLELAAQSGAQSTFDLTTQSIEHAVAQATGGDGFDVVCEATGLPISFTNAIEASAVGARLVLIGNGTHEVTFNQSVLIKKELDVFGSRNSQGVFDTLIDLLEREVIDVSPIRTKVVPFAEAMSALEAAANGATDDIKVLIEFPSTI